jgi:protein O-GlcNAc transferase
VRSIEHNNIAVDLQERGKLDEAIAEFRTAIRTEPAHYAAHFNLGYRPDCC